MAREKRIKIEAPFLEQIHQLVKLCKSNKAAAEYCQVSPGFLSNIKRRNIKFLSESTHKRISLVCGKSTLEEIQAVEQEIQALMKEEREKQAKIDEEFAERERQKMLAAVRRVTDLKIGTTYRVSFSTGDLRQKFNREDDITGKLIEISKEFLVFQAKNYRFTVLKKDLMRGYVTTKKC